MKLNKTDHDADRIMDMFVESTLSEDDFGGAGVGDIGSGGFSGVGGDSTFWSQWSTPAGGFWNGIIKPFVDVAKTALVAAADMTNRTWGLIKTSIVTVLKSVLPFVKNEVDKIQRQTKQRSLQLEQKYAHVLNAFSDKNVYNDMNLVLFLLNPGAFFGGHVAKMSGSAVKGVYDSFNIKQRPRQTAQRHESKTVNENNDEILRLVNDINRSSLSHEMKRDGTSLIEQRLSSLVSLVERIDGMTLEQLEKQLGVNIKTELFDDRDVADETIVGVVQREVASIVSSMIKSEIKIIDEAHLGIMKTEVLNLYNAALSKISK